ATSPISHRGEQAVREGGGNIFDGINSPRTAHILSIINTRNVNQIKLLRGVGPKKAELIVDCLCEMDNQDLGSDSTVELKSLAELGKLRGVGLRTVENMRSAANVQ